MATITLTGAASNLITYTGVTSDRSAIVVYIPKNSVGIFYKAKTDRIAIQVNGVMDDYIFANETERNSALATMLTYF